MIEINGASVLFGRDRLLVDIGDGVHRPVLRIYDCEEGTFATLGECVNAFRAASQSYAEEVGK